jgi:glycosyltransferase involved in cell wall biosynthesis
MSPKFSIGIPTYNRAHFLRESLGCALAQTADDLEIVVSDNASTDDTAEVVRGAGSRVRYSRNPTNIGGWRNFRKVVELAQGEYFSWLQDDDAIHCEFAQRACEAFDKNPDVVAYIPFVVWGPSPQSVHFSALWGAPFAMDWCRGTPRKVDGKLVAPLSLMMSVGIPPTIAFRRKVLLEKLNVLDDKNLLYNERLILAAVASEGSILADPRIGGFFRDHAAQSYKKDHEDWRVLYAQFERMVADLQEMMAPWGDDWQDALRSVLKECPLPYRERWRRDAQGWPCDFWLCNKVKEILEADMPPLPADGRPARAPSRIARALGVAPLWQKARRTGRKLIGLCTSLRNGS